MKKSRGFWTKSTRKLSKSVRQRGKIPITRIIQRFQVGQKVHITINTSVQKGMPHPRFQGQTGTVLEKRGRSYVVEINDANAKKKIISAPVHLKAQRGE